MNRVLLTGRLTRDPEMRSLPSGKTVTSFSVATNEYRGGEERTEYHSIVTWERLAQICGQFLGKGQMVSLEGRLQTRCEPLKHRQRSRHHDPGIRRVFFHITSHPADLHAQILEGFIRELGLETRLQKSGQQAGDIDFPAILLFEG